MLKSAKESDTNIYNLDHLCCIRKCKHLMKTVYMEILEFCLYFLLFILCQYIYKDLKLSLQLVCQPCYHHVFHFKWTNYLINQLNFDILLRCQLFKNKLKSPFHHFTLCFSITVGFKCQCCYHFVVVYWSEQLVTEMGCLHWYLH